MQVLGIDFTSRPNRNKPITCVRAEFDGQALSLISRNGRTCERWTSFTALEEELRRPGPWIAGMDFPFGLARKFIENIGWPSTWREYALHAESLGRAGFRRALDVYRRGRENGDREHRRKTDCLAKSISPQKLYGVPVGLMFFEGAPRLARSGVTIPMLQDGDPDRIVVEAYPGVVARSVIETQSYKTDSRKSQSAQHLAHRRELLRRLSEEAARRRYGFEIIAPEELCDDPTGDELDAFLAAIQAAWAWGIRGRILGFQPMSIRWRDGSPIRSQDDVCEYNDGCFLNFIASRAPLSSALTPASVAAVAT
jgi:Protein of unknown function (DUF429)